MRAPFALILAISLVALPGCASKYGVQQTQAVYYPQCYQPIQDLRNSENTVSRNTGAGALLGAFSGAIIGLLASGGKWQGAVMGGAVGAAGGAMAGNMYGRHVQESDDNVRLANYLQNLDGDISNLNVTSAAARSSLQCYDQQFQYLLQQIKSRQISREAASQRFAEIQSGREEAIAILGNAAEYGKNLNMEYENAFNNEERQLQQAVQTARPTTQTVKKAAAIKAARNKKRVLANKTSDISSQRQAALATSSQQTREINEAFANLSDIRS